MECLHSSFATCNFYRYPYLLYCILHRSTRDTSYQIFLFSYLGTFYWKCGPEVTNLIFNSPGFDHQHPEVYEHCKRLLLHLLIVQGANSNVQSVAMVLLRNRDFNEPRVLTVKPVAPELNLTGQSNKRRSTIV